MDRDSIALIGFGEAGRAFATGLNGKVAAFDPAVPPVEADGEVSVVLCEHNRDAVRGAGLILSLVTANQAIAAATQSARAIAPDALFCDMNSVAPQTKRAAAERIEAAGGRYVDVAVMAPVHPARCGVPLLVSGPHADAAVAALTEAGFTNVRTVPGPIGAASAIKMIQSVMVKGVEALTADCLLAAEAAGVRDAVIASLDASPPAKGWAERGHYNLDRMMIHGLRRAAEMEEVVATLEALGTGADMARATVVRQRVIGALGLRPATTLDATLAALAPHVSATQEVS